MTLIENDQTINNDIGTANVINNFFSNLVTNINVPEYHVYEWISGNISNPILRAIVKYRNSCRYRIY